MRKFSIAATLVLLLGVTAGMSPPGQFGVTPDEMRIRAAVLDYAAGIYDRDAERMERALHPDVRRHVQATRPSEGAAELIGRDELVSLADGRRCDARMPRKGPRRVLVYELRDNVAAVRLTAAWGVDLLHLAKADGEWRIIGIVGSVASSSDPNGDTA
jgi:hypothetical protein